MELQQEHRAKLQRWLRINAVCQLTVAITPLTTMIMMYLTGFMDVQDWLRFAFSNPVWWLLICVPYVIVPLLIVPFAVKTCVSSSLSSTAARNYESWKFSIATAMYLFWLGAGPGYSWPRWTGFTLLGAILLCALFYPALIHTWKEWNKVAMEEIIQRRLEEERNATSGPSERFPSEVEYNREREVRGPSETDPLLARSNV